MSALDAFLEARDFLLQHREDYIAAKRDFRWPALTRFNWALDYFDAQALGNTAPALWIVEEDGSETQLSWSQMSARSNQVANHLRGLGVRRGDRVLIMLPNHVALWETMLATMKLGAVMIPATLLLSPEDLEDRLDRGGARYVVASASQTAKFAQYAGRFTGISVGGQTAGWQRYENAYDQASEFTPDAPTHADDPALLYFTSGTTSKPKLVLHTHASYPVGHLTTMYWIGLRPGDLHYNISSPGWAKHAWSCFFAPWSAGATIFIYNYNRFDAPTVLDVLVRCGVSSLCAPPTVWRMLVQQDLAAYPVKLRELIGAGEPLNPEIIERVRSAWKLTIRDGFGQTETTAQIGNTPGQLLKPGSMGRALPGCNIALLDADGNPADEGEIAIALEPRALALMQGYIDDPDKTAAVMRNGYYRTGDVASRDADGYYTYVGRADDVFKSSDYRISPFELESALIEHPAVAEAAVVPSPDALRLSVPKAFLSLRSGYAPSGELAADILSFAAARLSAYKRIRRLEFYDLPKTISGKIRRAELRRMELARSSDARRELEFWEQDFGAR
ncbi:MULTISPECIES: AMP-binding protein [Hydrocarboniphaga]|uniref:AMP-dependent synthetase and ligase n=1 Tax=Hydrocarboniphaga effusa AP103 TaxID=1172194 RepID=I8T7N2_9GAMM|nr:MULTISPECIES: AMP-binding protein [Hydrocarboniphaga]EIT69768.1 AMP-dependent synthetase and ligase [Hydrocarboniphaga effusa AP103]MDZ4078850.1 AMP-binding protein [Hydrocarboniphaga sp.]